MLVDSHCHLNMLDLSLFNNDIGVVVAHATAAGVSHLLNVSVDWSSGTEVIATAERFPNVFASVGIHPNEETGYEIGVDQLIARGQHPKVVAIGETGLDYYRLHGDKAPQQQRFRQHVQAARALNKAVIIHTRDAGADTIRILEEEGAREVGGVLHCFTDTWEIAKAALDINFYISFSGIVTFKNAVELQAIAKQVPLDRMLIETDSPYLAPVPYRGKPNQPAYVREVARYLATLRGVSFEELAEITTANFFKLFTAFQRTEDRKQKTD